MDWSRSCSTSFNTKVCYSLSANLPEQILTGYASSKLTIPTKNNSFVYVRGRPILSHTTAINKFYHLSNEEERIYDLIKNLDNDDYEVIKDQLCEPITKWNGGRNMRTVNRRFLNSEAKLWKIFVKQNLMLTSHNATINKSRLVIINAIMNCKKFNVGEVISREIADCGRKDKACLNFPCLITALCNQEGVPQLSVHIFTPKRTRWTRNDYMKRMNITKVVP
ncbi:hypothetical protein GQ457_13G016900 [Hibiscus cannabinus]